MSGWTKLFVVNLGLAVVVCVGYIYFGGLGDGTPQRGSAAPAFDLPVISQVTVDGRRRLGVAAFGGGPVLVNFWASWCSVCKAERPVLAQLAALPELRLVGVATSDTEEAARLAEMQEPHGYPVVFDVAGQTADAYAVRALPMTVLIDADGTILRRIGRGLRDEDVEAIRTLLAKKKDKST